MSGNAKIHHYVPQSLLKNFGIGKKKKVNVFDKQTGNVFLTNAKNIAGENGFYNFSVDNESYTIEPALARFESDAIPILKNIEKEKSISSLTQSDRATLCIFLSVQFTRTRSHIEQIRFSSDEMAKRIRNFAEDQEQLDKINDYIGSQDENEITTQMIRAVSGSPHHFAPHFYTKSWFLASTSKKTPFIINDNPLVMHNMNDLSPRGSLGLAVPGIEIYLPISPTLVLAMWCQSISDSIKNAAQTLLQLERTSPDLVKTKIQNPENIKQLWKSISTGSPLEYTKENVTHLNSLQVLNSERYLFSSTNDFRLAQEMISINPKMRLGPRPQMD